MKNLSIKNKTLLFIFTIILISFGIFFYLFYQYQTEEIAKVTKTEFLKVKNSFEKNTDKYLKEHYTKVANKFITKEMIEAIAKEDRAKLLVLSKDSYNQLKLDDPYLEQFHFHKKDGKTLLRLHKVEFFDDDIAALRLMPREVHKKQTILTGFEVGLHSFSYRIFIPLFYKNNYIGAFELGVSPKKIVDNVTFFNQIDALIVVNTNTLKNKYDSITYTQIKDSKILRHIPPFSSLPQQMEVEHEGKNISIFSFDINDFSNTPMAKFVFFQDITTEHSGHTYLAQKLFILFLISVVIAILVINFGFNLLISKLERSYEKLQRYTKLIDETIITSSTDLEGNITSVSQAFCDISGYSKQELIGQNHRIIKHTDLNQELYKELWNTIINNQMWKGELKNSAKDGTPYWVKATISPVFDKKGKKIGYTAIRENITNQKKIEELSITDGLTNIFNRRHFNEIFPKVINGAKRKNLLICMMILDVDFFKLYNDNYGHSMGDDTLIKVAECLKTSLKRANDLAFRLGGEEFAIIFTTEDRTKALEFANIIRTNIEQLNIEHNWSPISKNMTVSIGLVCKRAIEVYDKETIYKEADHALYDAKKGGRNRVVVSTIG
jgi:diguanylate cyclase (GGDEF)-like protein/PAS domain S-box-containing protein